MPARGGSKSVYQACTKVAKRGRLGSFKLCRHRGRDLAYCRVAGTFHYFGKWGLPETEQRYRTFIASHLAVQALLTARLKVFTAGDLVGRWMAWMTQERGVGDSKVSAARTVALDVCRTHAALPVDQFGPKVLQQIQRRILNDGRYCRSGINRRIRDIVGIWKWGVSEELVTAGAWQALSTVRPLRGGVGWDPLPRTAADSGDVALVVDYLESREMHGAARCIRFMRATGCRPSEAFGVTWSDMNFNSAPPICVIGKHKGTVHGLDRVLVLNEQAVAAVHDGLTTRLGPDAAVFPNSVGNPWEKTTLAHVVERACRALRIPKWTPYQLRHLVATESVNRTGSEAAAAALLGHSPDSKMIRRYSRDRLALAMVAARVVGVPGQGSRVG